MAVFGAENFAIATSWVLTEMVRAVEAVPPTR